MSWYGDPDALDAAARQLSADALAVRGRARTIGHRVAAMRWEGEAAAAFARSIAQEADALHRAARELDEAAAALHAHAAEVRARLHRIRVLEDAVSDWFSTQLRSLRAAAEAVTEAVTDPLGALRRAAADPPWTGWSWRPGTLPASGDRAWLEVGDYLRARGVRL